MIQNLDLYAVFMNTAYRKSLKAAAEALHISQPALSISIKNLESSLGVTLFYRTNRGIRLTPEGELLSENLSKAFTQVESVEEKLRALAGLDYGTLRIGASDMTLRFYLLDHLERFHKTHPNIRLSVTNAPSPQTIEALQNGLIDFGIVSQPCDYPVGLPVDFTPVREIRDIFVCTDDYAHLIGHAVTQKELLSEPLILLDGHTSTRRYLDSFFAPLTMTPAVELATSDLILEFAKRGIGVAAIVEDFARQDIEEGKLNRLILTPPLPPRQFLLATLRSRPLPAPSKAFFEQMLGSSDGKNKKSV